MTLALASPDLAPFTASSLTLAATRSWRSARDDGRPAQAALFQALDAYRCGILAPVFASLIAFYESFSGRPIRVGGPGPAGPSADEHHLLVLLEGPGEGGTCDAPDTGLAGAMRIALRSTRIMIRSVLGTRAAPPPPVRGSTPGSAAARGRRPCLALRRREPPSALTGILRASYPVTARMLGGSGFDAAALAFARRYRPDGPATAGYGDGFAEFLAGQPRIAGVPGLADVAALERLWTEAHLAPGAPVLDPGDLGDGGLDGWAARRLKLHPAARFIWLATPAVTTWRACRDGCGTPPPERRAEGALVTRPADRVSLRPIGRPEHRILFGLRLGESVGEAAAAAASLYREADVESLIAGLAGSGAFAGSPAGNGSGQDRGRNGPAGRRAAGLSPRPPRRSGP
jgi:hypothetical protein